MYFSAATSFQYENKLESFISFRLPKWASREDIEVADEEVLHKIGLMYLGKQM